jgi:hypothetical protein
VNLAEGNSGTTTASFKVTVSPPSPEDITVNFTTSDNTATAPDDYTSTSGMLTIPANAGTAFVPVTVLGDVQVEANENFSVTLSSASGAILGDSHAVGTIVDDDAPPVESRTYSPIADASIMPGTPTTNYGGTTVLDADNSPVEHFLIKFTAPEIVGKSIVGAKLRLHCVNSSDRGGDFHRVSDNSWAESSVNWSNAPAYDASNLASLSSASSNSWYEVDLTSLVAEEALGDGIFSLRVNSTSTDGADWASKERSALLAPQLVVSYYSTPPPPPPPSISITDVSVAEGNAGASTATFTVSLSPASTETVTVNYATANGTATAPGDYTSSAAQLTFPPGTETMSVPITVLGDVEAEQNETLLVNLTDAFGAALADGQAVGTIVDDDTPDVQTRTYNPNADATIASATPAKNFGAITYVRADKSPLNHFLIRFSAPEVVGKTIVSAKLRMHCLDASGKGGDFHRVTNNSWSETAVNWNNAPAYDAAIFTSFPSVSRGVWYEVDLTNVLREEASIGDGVFTFRVNIAGTNGVDWGSKQNASRAPQLVLTYW